MIGLILFLSLFKTNFSLNIFELLKPNLPNNLLVIDIELLVEKETILVFASHFFESVHVELSNERRKIPMSVISSEHFFA
jgi:hypothetical protein